MKHNFLYPIHFFLFCIIFIFFIQSQPVFAQENSLTPVVAGYVSNGKFIYKDNLGGCRGYAAEYLDTLSQYAGWKITYTQYSSISEMINALEQGDIDIASGFNHTPEREEKFLFSDRSMNHTYLSLIVRKEDPRYFYGALETLNGMTVGLQYNSNFSEQYLTWAKKAGIDSTIKYFYTEEAELNALENGTIDGTVTTWVQEDKRFRPVAEFYPIYSYFILPKNRNKLKAQLDIAMETLTVFNPNFETELYNKYLLYGSSYIPDLTQKEQEYIKQHPIIRVAVQSHDAPYSEVSKNGTITGIIPEFFNRLASVSHLYFQYIAGGTESETETLVKNGGAEILGLSAANIFDAQANGLMITNSYASISLVQVSRKGTEKVIRASTTSRDLSHAQDVLISEGTLPMLTARENASACFQDLESGDANAIIVDMAAASWLLNRSRASDYVIFSLPDSNWNASAAVSNTQSVLFSILNKAIYSTGNVFDEIVTHQTMQDSIDTANFLDRIPFTWILIAALAALFMLFLVIIALLATIRRRKEENLLASKEIEAERQSSEIKAAVKANRERSRFFSTASHDMRTPLNGIIGFTDLAQDTNDMALKNEYLEKIHISADLLRDLVNDTLTVSRIESGKFELVLEPVDSFDLLEEIIVPIRAAADNKKVNFKLDTTKARRCTILADKLNTKKIFLNLLSNAIKFTPAGGQVTFIDETIPDPEKKSGHTAHFIVRDNGVGISPEFLPHIYEPFRQEHANTIANVGTGLGLNIVHQLIDIMHGTISVHSIQGSGTDFIVDLHFDEVAEKTLLPSSEKETSPDLTILNGKKVLLCEDNKLNQEIAKTVLEAKGMVITIAENGQQGYDIFRESLPGFFNLILMDLRMPVMDGFTATEQIRALDRPDSKKIPIIAMSADAFEDDIRRSLSSGMNGHISKPFDQKTLYNKLAEIFQSGLKG